MRRDTFVLRKAYFESIKLLDIKQRGELLSAIYAHIMNTGAYPLDQQTQILFNTIKAQLDMDKAGKSGAQEISAELKPKCAEVLSFMSSISGKTFRPVDTNMSPIAARLTSGATVQECRSIAALKFRQWKEDPKMMIYFRPETLYGKTKFEGYYAELQLQGGVK